MENKNLIGRRKYEALKSLSLENISDEALDLFNAQFPSITVAQALKQIDEYESTHQNTGLRNKSVSEYFKKINSHSSEKKIDTMTKDWLWKTFSKNYKDNEGVSYSREIESLENIKPLIYYFLGDEDNFVKCKNISLMSEPSIKKGLLIIGGYGNGKTSVMKALEKSLIGTNIPFKTKTANDIVTMYESCSNEHDKKEFWKYLTTGTLNFDDLLTEREANNYGKINLFKDIIEKRYDGNKRTYITCNYNDEFPEDLEKGLEQIANKYGSRAYDRIFSMFNIVTFKGKSFRV